MARIAFEEMEQVVFEAFRAAGMSEAAARTCASVHTESSCDGIYSHGLNRVARFVDYVRRDWVDVDAAPKLVKRVGAIEIHDGQFGPGILNALFAIDRAMEMASQHGVAITALRSTTHWMRGGTYGWRAVVLGRTTSSAQRRGPDPST